MALSRVFGLGERIGSGGFSHVYKGTNTSTGAVCAIKKSRASLKLKRTLLKYEANILKRLDGHPAIPVLYGYGRFEHFEYLALELLGNSLLEKSDGGFSMQELVDIGTQVLSALRHIHSHGIVHRDIKPQNILARYDTDFSHIYIIDFGLARRRLSGTPRQVDLEKERINVVGTLSWASLNALNGIDLNPRDDVESLAFILLYLLRGDLPWHKLCNAGTAVARITQIRAKMLSWNGARLGEGYPSVFGKLLDYARHLGFDEPIDYERFRSDFAASRNSKMGTKFLGPGMKATTTKQFPVAAGDIVLAQIDMRTSVEGYTFRDENSSYRLDPSLLASSWRAPFRPAVILSLNEKEGGIRLVALTNSTPTQHRLSLKEIGVDYLPHSLSSAYVFPRVLEIRFLPSQAPVRSPWKLSSSTLQKLRDNFPRRMPILRYRNTEDSDPDVRHDTRLQLQSTVFYANLLPLDSSPDTEIVWTGVRGWFDECVKVGRRQGWENSFFWTGHPAEEVSLPNSYRELDAASWDFRQDELEEELEIDGEDIYLPLIDEVI